MLTYFQSSGQLMEDMELLATGYSGAGEGKNNPSKDHIPFVGPIPVGLWDIGEVYTSKTKGPRVITLTPHDHNAKGRKYFRIHGDSRRSPGRASQGCIILSRSARELIIELGYKKLLVLP